MTTRREKGIFKMAVARTRAMVSESFDSFVAPVIQKSVPNHLLETSKNIRIKDNDSSLPRTNVCWDFNSDIFDTQTLFL